MEKSTGKSYTNYMSVFIMVIASVIIGVYAHNNTELKNELKNSNQEIIDQRSFYEKKVTHFNNSFNTPVEYYCSDGFKDGSGIAINVTQDFKGMPDESINFEMKVLDQMVVDNEGKISIFCMRGKPSYAKGGRTFQVMPGGDIPGETYVKEAK